MIFKAVCVIEADQGGYFLVEGGRGGHPKSPKWPMGRRETSTGSHGNETMFSNFKRETHCTLIQLQNLSQICVDKDISVGETFP